MIDGSPEGAQTVTANLDVRLKPACSRSGFAVESAERFHDDQTRATSSIGGHRDHEGRLFSEPRPAFPGYVPTQAGVVNLDGQATRVVDGFVETIGACGAAMAEHYPPDPSNTNELSDGLIQL